MTARSTTSYEVTTMTVEDLIEILQQMPKDKDVFVGYSNGACDYLTDRIDIVCQDGSVQIWGN